MGGGTPGRVGSDGGGRGGGTPRGTGYVQLVVITGMSGAGKSEAMRSMEDLGYFCVDNLPPALLPKFVDMFETPGEPLKKVAVVIDIRGGDFFDDIVGALAELDSRLFAYQILFLEADDAALVRRYKESRRRHPMATDGRILEGIATERERLEILRGRAHHIIDTSRMTPQDLNKHLAELYGVGGEGPGLAVSIVSFGYKHGVPLDADLVFDIRFLPNPYYVTSLRPKTGLDDEVRDYVMSWPVSGELLSRLQDLLDYLLPHYANEGKSQLTIAIGCTGGQHRSVVLGSLLGRHLAEKFPSLSVHHRDLALAEGAAGEREAGGGSGEGTARGGGRAERVGGTGRGGKATGAGERETAEGAGGGSGSSSGGAVRRMGNGGGFAP